MKHASALFASLALLTLAGCASDDTHYRDLGPGGFGRGGGGDARPDRGAAFRLFISPAGKPFRGKAGEPYPSAAWFAAADTDHDGKLTLAEFRKDHEAFFHELDTNHDGVIDGFEAQAYERDVAPEILPRVEGLAAGEGMDLSLGKGGGGAPEIGSPRGVRGASGRAGDRTLQGAGLFALLNEPQPVAACDRNFDGRITLAEFLEAADRRFEALDTAKRGYLTLGDLPKTPVQLAAERATARKR